MANQVYVLHRGGRKYRVNDYTTGIPSPQILGYTKLASSANSYNLAFPGASTVGSMAIIFGGHGYNWNLPSGWTSNNATNQSNWNGCIFSKVLTQTDITNGSVTVTAAGTYDGCIILIVCGFTNSVKQSSYSTSTSNVSSLTGPSLTGISSTNLTLIFGSDRANNVPSSNQGNFLVSFTDSSAASAAVYYSTTLTSVNPTFTYGGGNNGAYQAVVIV